MRSVSGKTVFYSGAILLTVSFLVLTAVFPSSAIYCDLEEIDLNSGRARVTSMRFLFPVSETYRHTPVSEALEVQQLDSPVGDWQPVNAFGFWMRHSPHYFYHGAYSQAKELGIIWQSAQFTGGACKESAETVLRLWREAGSDSTVDEFLYRLAEIEQGKITQADVRTISNSNP